MKPVPTATLFQQLLQIDVKEMELLDREAINLAIHLLQALNIRDVQTVDIPENLKEPSDIARHINRVHVNEIDLISLNTV